MRKFTQHPNSIGLSYTGHMMRALKIGSLMIAGGAACLIHAIFPMLFTHTASRILTKINCLTAK